MTNEMQLARAAGLPANGHEFVPGPSFHNQQHAKPMGLKKMHRLLRGRYPLVIALGALCAIVGALVGYSSQKPMFASEVKVRIMPTVPSLHTVDEQLPTLSTMLQDQVELIWNREMAARAISQPTWKAINPTLNDDTVNRFYGNLDVEALPGSIIHITFTDPDPKVALAGAKAIWEAYSQYFSQNDQSGLLNKIDFVQKQIYTLGQVIAGDKDILSKISPMGPDNLKSYQAQEQAELAQMTKEWRDAMRELDEATAMLKSAGVVSTAGKNAPAPTGPTLTAAQIELIDPTIRQYTAKVMDFETMVKRDALAGYGIDHPKTIRDNNDLLLAKQQLEQYVTTFNQTYHAGLSTTPKTGESPLGANLEANVAAKRVRAEGLKKECEAQEAEIVVLAGKIAQANEAKQRLEKNEALLSEMQGRFFEFDAQRKLMASQMDLMSAPTLADHPATDNRRKVAIVGFFGGLMLPACIVLLIGLLDGRFRYSDETNTDLGGVPLLGILPNLPDLLSDPEQAATAAHCVHQIRTILQITGAAAERRAIAVTSGSPGDGKTSLCLALGLSFAASGSRTLLIDADLVGGGLTSRLNVAQDHGVLEAMASRDILGFIRSTDVTDLSILPVGQALGGYTGTIAPAAVRKLVNEAKKHFEIVVIDTGPILGSIEASPVAVAVDGVVLCVSRGQQRQLVDRAVQHLHSIGAKLAGVVFNRAQSHDFERSMSRQSMKPLPSPGGNGNGKSRSNGERIGPVAKAVASSVRPSSGTSNRS